jgi:hypothetical protein
MAPKQLHHGAIKFIVLHLDYGRLDPAEVMRRLNAGTLPSASYMQEIIALLQERKEIHLRVNFASPDLSEAKLVYNFFVQIPQELLDRTVLKYSFNTRVAGDASVSYETPESLRHNAHLLQHFVDEFTAAFPNVVMLSERPLFPCSFEQETWSRYAERGGFLSSCDMEYTFYPTQGLALCPPSRNLVAPKQVSNPAELRKHLVNLRYFLEATYRIPSFTSCESCDLRKDLTCQGGCLGYKVGREDNSAVATPTKLISITSLRR